MEIMKYILILLAGSAAGFFNVVAGGGSLIAISALIFLGLPPAMANGSNRIAIISQNIIAVKNFKQKGYFDLRAGLLLGVTAIAGALIGSRFAVDISGDLFKKILSGVMILVLILTLFGNIKRSKRFTESDSVANLPWLAVAFFFVGIYGGFIQAGVGFIIMAVFSLLGRTSLVKTNSVKVFVVLLYTIPSLFIFIINGKVDWIAGLILALGNSIGAWFGSNFSVAKGDRWIRVILTVTVVAMSLRLMFL